MWRTCETVRPGMRFSNHSQACFASASRPIMASDAVSWRIEDA